jgi:hypothetical protein
VFVAISPAVVEQWLELSTPELRTQVRKLVSSRLARDHAVWRAIRRHPALVARIRGVLSGLTAEAVGSKDEHMQKVWIAATRTALDEETKLAVKKPVKKEVPPPVVEPDVVLEEPKREPLQQRPDIPAMVFQEPS